MYYKSSQRLKQPLIWALLIGIAALFWYAFYVQIILGEPLGSRPAPDALLVIIWLLTGIVMPFAAYKSELVLEVDHARFAYRFIPFHINRQEYPISAITNIEKVKIRPVLNFGGYGIRYSFKGKGYIQGGSKGIKVSFRSGRPVFFSTNHPDEFVEAFKKIKKQRF